MTALTEYEKDLNRYIELINRKMELEHQIRMNADNQDALTGLRSDYRNIVEESDKIYQANYQHFNEVKLN